MVAAAFLTLAAGFAFPSQSQWLGTQGYSGRIQDPSKTLGYIGDLVHWGWGLSFVQLAGTENWVHFAVPTPAQDNWTVDKIMLDFETDNSNSWISQIDLWDGAMKFKTITGKWFKKKNVEISLGQQWKIYRALGVSVQIKTKGSKNQNFHFYAVAGHFVLPSSS